MDVYKYIYVSIYISRIVDLYRCVYDDDDVYLYKLYILFVLI
jgi:hypothetical protein